MKNKILLVAVASVAVLSLYALSSSHGHHLHMSKIPFLFQRTQSRGNQQRYHQSIPFKTTVGASAFTVTDDFAFPHGLKTLKDIKKIVSTKWVLDLASIMTRWPINRTVIVVSGNTEFQKPLLNWMISAVFKANISLDRILILATDNKLHGLLKERNIGSILVPPSSVYNSSLTKIKFSTHKLVTYSRFAIIRLLNHWGFTVAHFDSDALLLRDIQKIFDEYQSSSIVASRGSGPRQLCAGGILFRSSRQIEDYWTEASEWKGDNDQKMINEVLTFLKVKWHRHLSSDSVDGECLKNGMQVSILPSTLMCRQTCSADLLNKVYVWHPPTAGQGNGLDVIKTMSKNNLVFVSQDWSETCDDEELIGEAWLKCISTGI